MHHEEVRRVPGGVCVPRVHDGCGRQRASVLASIWKQASWHMAGTSPSHCLTSPAAYPAGGLVGAKPSTCAAAAGAAGSTDTSLWTHYKNGAREYCGNTFPDGMRKNERLAQVGPSAAWLAASAASIGSCQAAATACRAGLCLMVNAPTPSCAERHHPHHQSRGPRRAHQPRRHCEAGAHVAGRAGWVVGWLVAAATVHADSRAAACCWPAQASWSASSSMHRPPLSVRHFTGVAAAAAAAACCAGGLGCGEHRGAAAVCVWAAAGGPARAAAGRHQV